MVNGCNQTTINVADVDGEEDVTDWKHGETVDDGDNEDNGDDAECGTRGDQSKDRQGRPARSRRDSETEEELSEEGGNDVYAEFEVGQEDRCTDGIDDINELDVLVHEEGQKQGGCAPTGNERVAC